MIPLAKDATDHEALNGRDFDIGHEGEVEEIRPNAD